MKRIIDISEHQIPSEMNYKTLSSHVSLAIIRTQYGSKREDRAYKTHHKNFKARNVPTAAYAWVRGIHNKDMMQEAKDFYKRTVAFKPEIWFLDVEEKSMDNMRSGINSYIHQLRSLGAKKIGLYIAHHLYQSLNLNTKEADVIWLPHYGKNNGQKTSQPDFPCDLHQYTDRGRLPGYSGHFDLNHLVNSEAFPFLKTYKKITPNHRGQRVKNIHSGPVYFYDSPRWQKPSGIFLPGQGWVIIDKILVEGSAMYKVRNSKSDIYYITASPNYVAVVPTKPPKASYHIVKAGETVSGLALKYNTSPQQIKAWNQLKNIHLIFVGDRLRVR